MVRSLTLLSHVTIVYPSPCISPSGSVIVKSYVPEGPFPGSVLPPSSYSILKIAITNDDSQTLSITNV